jgi:acetylornithine/N-succinyldiaminopimelate aminotransferase
MLTTEEVSKAMQPGTHASTFGGNPLTCAAGCAVMDVLLEEGFLQGVRERSAVLRRHLEKLAEKHAPYTGEVRGRGMWLGVELNGDGTRLVHTAREHGVLVNIIHGHVLRIAPALNIADELMVEAFEKLDRALTVFIDKERPQPVTAAR